MKLRQIMSSQVVRIHPEEPVAVAARMFSRYNVGALPVCGSDGRLWGILTDRDLVTRCMAAGRAPGSTSVKDVMTTQLVTVRPDMDASTAAGLMAREQVRRLPVVENGKLLGMVSIADLAGREETSFDAVDALAGVSSNLSQR